MMGLARWLVESAAWLVPSRLRPRWRREWEAELWHRDRRLRADGAGPFLRGRRLVGPALGAFVHAGWLRVQRTELDPMRQDLAFALRSYRRSPGFTAAAVLTLGLGIAANVAVFTVARGALFRPYPYEDADRVTMIVTRDAERPDEVLRIAYPDLEELRATAVLSSVAAFDWDPFNLRLDERTEWVGGGLVSASLFETLGVHPIRGRLFAPGEDHPGAPPVAVLGERLWQSAFGGEDVVGRSVWLDGAPYEVVGIAPAYLDVPEGADLWVPLRPTGDRATRASSWLQAVARLAPGVSPGEADAALAALSRGLAEAHPATNEDRRFEAIPLREFRTGELRPAFLALMGAVGLVLLIVCANLTSLMLARSSARHTEFGVRQALGASRWRLARQLLTESLVLAALGGLLGLGLGRWASGAIGRLVPELPGWFDPALDPVVVAVGVGLALLSAALFGLAPVLAGAVRGLRSAVRAGRGTPRSRDALVFAEVALSTVLLLAAGLLVRSLAELTSVDPGFETERRISGTLQLPGARYAEDAQVVAFADRLVASLEARPDVEAAAAVTRMPFRSGINSVMWWEDGQGENAFRENPQAELNSVTPGYFETMGIARTGGRGFTEADREGSLEVAVISETFARAHFGSRDPLGRRISFSYPPRFAEIVGVVEDVKHQGLDQEAKFQIYVPFAQRPTGRLTVVARSRAAPGSVAGSLRAAVRELDPDLALSQVRLVEASVRESVWRLRLLTRLFWGFGLFAALLAAVGIAGVVAQAVARRRREIGIRMALGARAPHILGLVGRRIGGLLAAGLVAGALAAVLAGRLAEGLLFGVEPGDPLTFAAVLVGFAVLGILAAWLPARRAVGIDPARALRSD